MIVSYIKNSLTSVDTMFWEMNYLHLLSNEVLLSMDFNVVGREFHNLAPLYIKEVRPWLLT